MEGVEVSRCAACGSAKNWASLWLQWGWRHKDSMDCIQALGEDVAELREAIRLLTPLADPEAR